MSKSEILLAVIQQLRELFIDKGELNGYDDWDRFFGCINAIETVAKAIQDEETTPETEG